MRWHMRSNASRQLCACFITDATSATLTVIPTSVPPAFLNCTSSRCVLTGLFDFLYSLFKSAHKLFTHAPAQVYHRSLLSKYAHSKSAKDVQAFQVRERTLGAQCDSSFLYSSTPLKHRKPPRRRSAADLPKRKVRALIVLRGALGSIQG